MCPEPKAQEVRQARALASVIEMDLVARVLAMHVMKGVVGMPLVVERPDAGALESRAEVELPPQRGLHIVSEAPCRMALCGQRGVDVIIRRTERQQTVLFALARAAPEQGPGARGRRRCDGAIVLEPHGDVESDRLTCAAANGRGRMKTRVGRWFVEGRKERRRFVHVEHLELLVVRRRAEIASFRRPDANEVATLVSIHAGCFAVAVGTQGRRATRVRLAMVYRTNASELHDDEARAEARDLGLLVNEARSRRLRAGVVIAIVVLVMSVVPIALAAMPRGKPILHCHKVLVQYENAPNIPIEARDACEQRKD